jgi:signal transduction histidine kinase
MMKPVSIPKLWVWLVFGVCLSFGAMSWFGYRSVSAWQRSVTESARERAESTVDLLLIAVARDMRGVQGSLLATLQDEDLSLDPPLDIRHEIASAFARYPYPECFFGWRGAVAPNDVIFFDRRERPAGWLSGSGGTDNTDRFPVAVGRAPTIAAGLVRRISQDAVNRQRFSVFDIDISGTPYQAVVRLFYDEKYVNSIGAFGFLVNLTWVKQHYFDDLMRQIRTTSKADKGLEFSVLDADGRNVIHMAGSPNRELRATRTFQLAFFDPILVAFDPPPDAPHSGYVLGVSAAGDPAVRSATIGARWALALSTGAGIALVIALMVVAQATRASARLADMRSDFVSTVTHELKTPVAGLRAIAETWISGRIDQQRSREYAAMAMVETKRLTRLINNLLTYARITDMGDGYSFEALSVSEAVEAAVQEFRPQLLSGGFAVDVKVPEDLSPIRGDRRALGQLLDNVIDNAIRYSQDSRSLKIHVRGSYGTVVVEVADRGPGIPPADLPHVTKKFFRGQTARGGGSGLGLAIAQRIVEVHEGLLEIRSTVGEGTVVLITLPTVTSLAA